MTFLQSILAYFVSPIISLIIILIFVEVVFSWLVAFNIINLRNPMLSQIYHGIKAFTRPILDPIRRMLPNMGGLDISPIVALLGLSWVNGYVVPMLMRVVG